MADDYIIDPVTGQRKRRVVATDGTEFTSTDVSTTTPAYKPYNPDTGAVNAAANQATGYEGTQDSAIKQLTAMIEGGGLSAEQRATMFNAGKTALEDTATSQKAQAEMDAYSRGLGQSGVLSRSYGAIDKNTQQGIGQLSSDIEQKAIDQISQAISQTQSGIKSQQETALQKAQLVQQGEELRAKLSMDENNYNAMMTQLKSTESMSNADRELALKELATQYGLSVAEMAAAKEQADKEFMGDILGGLIGGAGTLLAGPAGGATASVLAKLLGL